MLKTPEPQTQGEMAEPFPGTKFRNMANPSSEAPMLLLTVFGENAHHSSPACLRPEHYTPTEVTLLDEDLLNLSPRSSCLLVNNLQSVTPPLWQAVCNNPAFLFKSI